MAKYTVRPAGGLGQLISRGIAKIYKDTPDGGREELGEYNQSMLPTASRTHRVFFDPEKRVYPISLSREELSNIAREMRLIDPRTDKLIEFANPENEKDPFFMHDELIMEVPNGGIVLDDATPEGRFWLAAMKSEPKLFNIDNNTDNPLVKKVQEYKVTTAGHSDSEMKEQLREGRRANAIFVKKQDDYQWLRDVCHGFDIKLGDNTDIEALRDIIFLKITTEKDFKTKEGTRNIERFLLLNDMPEDDFTTRAKIKEAIDYKIIKKEGKKYFFDEDYIGTSADKIFDFLSKEENIDVKGRILAAVMEKSIKA